MISYLEGKLISKNDKCATVLVGGIGYKVFMSAEALKKYNNQTRMSKYSLI